MDAHWGQTGEGVEEQSVCVCVCVCVWKVFLLRRVAGNVSIAP